MGYDKMAPTRVLVGAGITVLCMFVSLALPPLAFSVDDDRSVPLTADVAQVVLSLQADVDSASVPTEPFSVDGVTYEVKYYGGDETYYALVKGFSDASDSREKLVIPDEVPSPLDSAKTFHVTAVAEGAFMRCASLKSVEFVGTMGGRIGSSAFYGCTALESVTFADDCVLSRKGVLDMASNGNPIGSAVFAGCTSLTAIEIPVLASAASKGKNEFTMAVGHWHGQHTPVATNGAGLSSSVFSGCTALESVVFRAGHDEGAYAYCGSSSGLFQNCVNLRSIVFECRQAFWLNPDSVYATGGTGTIAWDWETYAESEAGYPTLYYAVDYYASEQAARADAEVATPNCSHANRIGRVDYARGTAMADIASNRASGYANADGHANLTLAQDVAPDPATAAGHAGESGWVWKFEQPYGFCETLTEACYAYPARAADLSAGHASSTALDNMRVTANRFMEKWFDIERYRAARGVENSLTDEPQSILYLYRTSAYTGDAAHTLLLNGEFEQDLSLTTADGISLERGRDYTRTFKRYDEDAGVFTDEMSTPDGNGPYLMRFAGLTGSAYEGTALEVWIRVQGHAVAFSMTRDIGDDAGAAALTNKVVGTGSLYGNKAAPYAVLVDDSNPAMLYLGAAFAGFADAVEVPTTNGEYGPALSVMGSVLSEAATKRILAVGVSRETALEIEGNGARITPDRYDYGVGIDTPSKLAAAAYQAFNRDVARNGVADRSWGATAVLLPPDMPVDCSAMAAYSYSMKAPVFFAEEDGSVSESTIACLKDFKEVVVPGGTDVTPSKTVSDIEGAGLQASRIGEDFDGQCDFSIAVADALYEAEAVSYSTVTITAGCDPLYVSSGLTTSGFTGGIVFVTGGIGDTKHIVSHLERRGVADEMNRVYLMEPGKEVFIVDEWNVTAQIRRIVAGEGADTELVTGDVTSSDGALYAYGEGGSQTLVSRYDDARPEPEPDLESEPDPTSDSDSSKDSPSETDASTDASQTGGSASESEQRSQAGATVDISSAVVEGVVSKTYNGNAQTQTVTVTLEGKTLAEGVDYAISYADNVNAGIATLVVAGQGSYTGEVTRTFQIEKAAQPMKAKGKTKSAKYVKLRKGKQTVKPLSVSGAKGAVTFKKKSGSGKLSVKAKTGAVVVKRGTPRGVYKMKVRVTSAGDGNYLPGSQTVTVKVKVK